jgi:hypothetical protein
MGLQVGECVAFASVWTMSADLSRFRQTCPIHVLSSSCGAYHRHYRRHLSRHRYGACVCKGRTCWDQSPYLLLPQSCPHTLLFSDFTYIQSSPASLIFLARQVTGHAWGTRTCLFIQPRTGKLVYCFRRAMSCLQSTTVRTRAYLRGAQPPPSRPGVTTWTARLPVPPLLKVAKPEVSLENASLLQSFRKSNNLFVHLLNVTTAVLELLYELQ